MDDALALERGRPLDAPSLFDFEFSVSDPLCHATSRHDAGERWPTAMDRLADPTQAMITGAGHFIDKPTMERAWTDALALAERRIDRWRGGCDRSYRYDATHPFIAEVDLGRVIGSTLSREEYVRGVRQENPASTLRIVLFPSSRFACGFEPYTAYAVLTPRRQVALAARSLEAYEAVARRPLVHIGRDAKSGNAFTSRADAREALAATLRRWSGDIDAWQSDVSATWPLRVTACMGHPVAEMHRGKPAEPWIATPLVSVTLTKIVDSRVPEGYVVTRIAPGRGY